MYRLFLIAKNNMKKQRGDMITFFILTMLSALLFFDCLSAIMGMDKVLEAKFEEVNGAHVILHNFKEESGAESTSAERAFTENEHIVAYERSMDYTLIAKYRKKGERAFSTFEFMAEAFHSENEMLNIKEPEGYFGRNDILLPYSLKSNYAIGDVIQIKLDDEIYDLNVVGYLEDPYFASTINISIYKVRMDGDLLEEMADDHPIMAERGYLHKGQMAKNDSYDQIQLCYDINASYKDELAKYADDGKDHSSYMLTDWEDMKQGAQFTPVIVMGTILIFSMLIMLIAVVIISFSIKNFIRKNMKNTGILEACGYKVSELRLAVLMQMTLISTIGSLCGIAIAILTFKGFGDIVSMVLGLSWNQPLNTTAAVITVLSIIVLIALASFFVSGGYNKVSVLDALRGGISTHNYKKNFFPLDRSVFPLPITLALKDTFGGLGGNIAVALMVCLLVVSTNVGFGMYENFGTDPENFFKIFGFEMGKVQVADIDKNDPDTVMEDLKSIASVRRVMAFYGMEPEIVKGDLEKSFSAEVYDDLHKMENVTLLEGRIPEQDNEIMLAAGTAKDMGFKVGDVADLKYGDEEADYLVVGICQKMQNMGRMVVMNFDGAKRLLPGGKIKADGYYVNTVDGVSYEQAASDIYEMMDEKGYDFAVLDLESAMVDTIAAVFMAMKLLCILIVAVTACVVVFVESLIVRAKISNEWKQMGISKAIGQTTPELVVQIMLTNMPAIAAGTLVGTVLSRKAGQNLCGVMFSIFELKKFSFEMSPLWIIFTAVMVLVIALATAAIEGFRVKNLIPVEMITEE